jgi:hypothetical protein
MEETINWWKSQSVAMGEQIASPLNLIIHKSPTEFWLNAISPVSFFVPFFVHWNLKEDRTPHINCTASGPSLIWTARSLQILQD